MPVILRLLSVCLLFAGAATLLVAGRASANGDAIEFDATFEGHFAIVGDVGNSPLFIVEDFADGEEATFGAFSAEATVRQNLARQPEGCGANSSTGAGGVLSLTFADGELHLRRTSGDACFAFPFVVVGEHWVISGGTGAYVGASGWLTRHLDGNILSGATAGTISGTVRLP